MSDEPIKLPNAPTAAPAGIYEHYCEHPGCKRWGGWGFAATKSTPPRWYCSEHKAEGERHL